MTRFDIQVPRLELGVDGFVNVRQWGTIGGMLLRSGDRLIVEEREPHDDYVMLLPRGWGQPMIGRRLGGRVVAEPSGVPVCLERWRVAGVLVAVERDLERGSVSGGRWAVAARGESPEATPVDVTDLEGHDLDASEVDLRCVRAALAPERRGCVVAVAAGPTSQVAQALLKGTPPGRIRYAAQQVSPARAVPAPQCLVLRFSDRVAPQHERQLSLFAS